MSHPLELSTMAKLAYRLMFCYSGWLAVSITRCGHVRILNKEMTLLGPTAIRWHILVSFDWKIVFHTKDILGLPSKLCGCVYSTKFWLIEPAANIICSGIIWRHKSLLMAAFDPSNGTFQYPPNGNRLVFNFLDTVNATWEAGQENSTACYLSLWYWPNSDPWRISML